MPIKFTFTVSIFDIMCWQYSSQQSTSTCTQCVETTNHLFLHLLFECDKQSHHRQFIIDQLKHLQNSDSASSTHPLFTLIDDWYNNNDNLDTDLLDTIFRFCMEPSATSNNCSISQHASSKIRSFFIDLCAMILTNLRLLLHPLHWYSIRPSVLVDLEDSSRRNIFHSARVQIQPYHYVTYQFPVFGSATARRTDPALQASATSFISDILVQYPNEYFLWSGGAYSPLNSFASAATLVSLNNQICYTSAVTQHR